MIDYKLKVMHDEYDTLNFSPMRQNYKAYLSKENNLGVDSSMFLPYDSNFCDTIFAENTDHISNNIPEIGPILSPHWWCKIKDPLNQNIN